jgi:hypothetical protein
MTTAAERACAHILSLSQTNPDVGYLIGPATESFELLCAAQAEYTGEPLEQVERERGRDLQPEHRKRQPDVVVLKARVQDLIAALRPLAEEPVGEDDLCHRGICPPAECGRCKPILDARAAIARAEGRAP